jgi:uncharacterized membrane protein YdbT with pleckstrin-like domain
MVVPTVQTVKFRCPHCHTPVDVDPQGEADVVVCPSCKKPFQVRVPIATSADGQVPPAVPARAQPEPGSPPAAIPVQAAAPAPAPPQPPQPASAPEEQLLRTIQVAMVRRYPGRVLAYLVVIVALLAGAAYLFNVNWVIVGWVAVAGAAIALGRLLLWWLRMHNTTLTITNRRAILETGILTRQKTEIDLDDLSDVQVHQGLFMQALNVGDLTLVSKGTDSARQVVIMAVPEAETVAQQVRELRVAGQEQGKPA